MQKLELNINRITCEHCAASAQQALNGLEGIQATVSFDTALAEISSDGQTSTLTRLY